MLYYVRLKDDKHKRRWKVRAAVSLRDAIGAINMARVTGSVGWCDQRSVYVSNKPVDEWPVTIMADVVRVNDDLTEVRPN